MIYVSELWVEELHGGSFVSSPRGGTQVQKGGRTFVTYFAEEGVFF